MIVGKMTLDLSLSVRSQIVSQHQIKARLKFSKRAVHGTLQHFMEIVSVVSKARSGKPTETSPSEDQYIKAMFSRR